METDLGGHKDGISERFVPDEDRGRLIEAEHLARYRWAAQAVAGRTVLDAGCGTAYGTRMLAEAGAREVVGVDIAASVLEAVGPLMPAGVRLEAADLRKLSFPANTFDLIVCFEVIEHFEDPLVVLDELVRVLTPDGVLLISSPNRGVYPEGNPHHYHEFHPDELEAELRTRLVGATLFRQQNYIVSGVLSGDDFERATNEPLDALQVHKLVGSEPDSETYTIAIAGNGELPELGSLATMTGTLEMGDWLSLFQHQQAVLQDRADDLATLEGRLAEADRASELLVEAERRLAGVHDLHLRIADLERELEDARAAARAGREQAEMLDERLMRGQRVLADVFSSPSWRLTKPLRGLKRILRRG